MLDDEILSAIQEQNLSYLLLAQKLLVDDRKMAMFRLHMDEAMADLISSLTIGQMLKISGSGQLLCAMALPSASKLSGILSNERSSSLVQIHTALMLASSQKSLELGKVSH